VKQTTAKRFLLTANIQKTKPMIIKSLVNTLNNVPTMITRHYDDNHLAHEKIPNVPPPLCFSAKQAGWQPTRLGEITV
jgi:hypothetical protein